MDDTTFGVQREATRFEEEIVNSSRKDGVDGIVRLPGVSEVIDSVSFTDIKGESMNLKKEFNCAVIPRLRLIACLLGYMHLCDKSVRDPGLANSRNSSTAKLRLRRGCDEGETPVRSSSFIHGSRITKNYAELCNSPDPYLLGAKLCGVEPSRCKHEIVQRFFNVTLT